MKSALAVVAVCSSTVAVLPRAAGASSITNDREKANQLYNQIQSINGQVELLGQKYDEAQIKLNNFNNQITHTKQTVAAIKNKVTNGTTELEQDAIFAYVTNGSAASNNPLFSSNASKIGATNVYNQIAEGNVSSTIASLKNYRIELTQERSVLNAEDDQARAATKVAANAFHKAKVLQAALQSTLNQVKGQIAVYVAEAAAAAAAKSDGALKSAKPIDGFPAPPPDSRANIAIRAALSYLGTWYCWGGASRSCVDCSGLIMLAYQAAGIDFPHYSGAQYEDTERVPLYDIEPGDLLFYGWHGDEHVAMYIGHGDMIEAEMTGTRVHITPIRLGYGFVGLGRPRA
jgi:cell wall-associated NlpC family hydrolase